MSEDGFIAQLGNVIGVLFVICVLLAPFCIDERNRIVPFVWMVWGFCAFATALIVALGVILYFLGATP